MICEVICIIIDVEMSYCWKWYFEMFFWGSKVMNVEGMIDVVIMILFVWYDIFYDYVVGILGMDNFFCDYDNDLQFNQNLFNYEQ